jgi:hypothetical protein
VAGAGTARALRKERQLSKRLGREETIKAFETADDITSLDRVTHDHVEKALKDLPVEESVKAIQSLSQNKQLSAKDAAIAARDLADSDVHEDALEALRTEFNITSHEEKDSRKATTASAANDTKKKSAKKTKKKGKQR